MRKYPCLKRCDVLVMGCSMAIVAPHVRKHLSADALFRLVHSGFARLPEHRLDDTEIPRFHRITWCCPSPLNESHPPPDFVVRGVTAQRKPPEVRIYRSMSHTLSRVKSGGGTACLLSVAWRIAYKATRLFHAFSCSWTPPSPCYTLLSMERGRVRIPPQRGAWRAPRAPRQTGSPASAVRAKSPCHG
jgi:hypothetical protein